MQIDGSIRAMTDLQVSVEALEGLQKRMTVTIPAAQIEQEVSIRLKKVGSQAKLKGFRPGKVPARIIRQQYGAGVRQEVLNEMVQSSYTTAIDQQALKPAAMPMLEQGDNASENDSDFTYTATFEVFPEFKLAAVDGFEVERSETDISAADVDDMIETLRKQRATWETVDRKAAEGDQVTVDFEGRIKGEPLEGGKGEDVEIVIGEGRMLEDFEKNLPGLAAGDETTFKVKFPRDYQAEDIAGKKAEFSLTIKAVAEQQLPDIDAEFVRGFGIDSGEIEAFRTDVQQNMEREARAMIESDVKRQVMEYLLEANPIDVPAALIDSEAGNLRKEAMRNLGIPEDSIDDPRVPALDTYREAAERRVRLSLLVGAVIEENDLEVDRDRVKDKIDEICAPYEDPEQFKKIYFQNPQLMSQVESMVLEEQVVDWLVAQAKLTVTPKAFADLRNG